MVRRPHVDQRAIHSSFTGLWGVIDIELLTVPTEANRWLTDEVVRRFNAACGHDMFEAFLRVRDTWQWRRSKQVDGVFRRDNPIHIEAREEGADGKLCVLRGVDAMQRAYVLWRPFERHGDRFEALLIYTMERAKRVAGPNRIVLLVDCVSNSGATGLQRQVAGRLAGLLMTHYPDCLGCVLVVDASTSQRVRCARWCLRLPRAVRRKIRFCRRVGTHVDWTRYGVQGDRIPEEMGGSYRHELDWDRYIAETPPGDDVAFETSFTSV